MRRAASALVFAVLLAPRGALAFCRITTTETKIDGPDITACYDTSDPPVYWPGACIGLSVQENGSRYASYGTVRDLLFDTILPNWMNADCPGGGHPSIAVFDLGAVACDEQQANLYGPNANIVMFHDDDWPYDGVGDDPTNCEASPTIALTTVTFNPDTGALWDADLEINSFCHPISTTLPVPNESFDLQSILQHETGHVLGLAHPPDPKAVMYYLYSPGVAGKRDLNIDDIRGLCTIDTPEGERTVGAQVVDGGLIPAGTCDAIARNGWSSACVSDAGNQPPPAQPTALTCSAGIGLRAGPLREGGLLTGLVSVVAIRARRRSVEPERPRRTQRKD
jgi:hypothetical protein